MLFESPSPSGILLLTKLHLPRLRPELTARPRLIERLNEGAHRKLTLISAGAGFGKTILLGTWALQADRPIGWVSLDEQDNDPVRFWMYVLYALHQIQPHAGSSALELLPALPIIDPETLLTALINDLVNVTDDFSVVLDDYNVIRSEAIHAQMTFLLSNLPPPMHLVIASRTMPPFPLARLRARGELVELRADDLRFTPEEANHFLKNSMKLALSSQDSHTLIQLCEGWIAGLQMSALLAQERGAVGGIIRSPDDVSRYVLDYLAEEVLEQQPRPIQDFLLKTSVLDRMSAALCEVITGTPRAQETLLELEKANLFIVPLDEGHNWYRYHVLFAEFLRNRLQQVYPDEVQGLHLRASRWYEQHDDKPEAIRHAILASDYERVARLVEQVAAQMFILGKTTIVRGWLGELPDSVVDSRVALDIVYTWTYILEGQLEIAAIHLKQIEKRLTDQIREATTHSRTVYRNLLGEVHVLRALSARLQEDIPTAVAASQDALKLLGNTNSLLAMLVTINLGQSYWLTGDVASASRTFTEALAIDLTARNLHMTWIAVHNLARLAAARGHLRHAMDMYRQARDMLDEFDGLPSGAGILYAGMGELLYEWNDLDNARQYLAQDFDITSPIAYPDNLLSHCYYHAMTLQASGDFQGAFEVLQPAVRRAQQIRSDRMRAQIEGIRARLWLLQGDIRAALEWVNINGIHPNDEPRYDREADYLTLAMIMLEQDKPEPVIPMLHGFIRLAESQGRMARVVSMVVLLSAAYYIQGDTEQARVMMRRALILAEPEGYIRTFVDGGLMIARILQTLEAGPHLQQYVNRLLAAFQTSGAAPLSRTASTPATSELLSDREREVLALIARGMSNKAIADELVLSVGTVKSHTKSIFRKLDVHSRTQAIRRGYDLGLLKG